MTTTPEPDEPLSAMAAALFRAQGRSSEATSDKPLSTANPLNAEPEKSLSVPKPLDASVATFLEYLDAFSESLENALAVIEESEQYYKKYGKQEFHFRYEASANYASITKQYEGTYYGNGRNFFDGMRQLLRLLYVTMHKGTQSKFEPKPLTDGECSTLFSNIAIHAGFSLTFFVTFLDDPQMHFTPFDSYTRLIDFTRPLRKQDWDTLQSEAIKRITRLGLQAFLERFRDCPYNFSYYKSIASSEVTDVVSEIIAAEVLRFRRFMEAFQGTLQFLAAAKPLAQMNIKPPVFDLEKRTEALQIFRETMHLVQTISSGTVPATLIYRVESIPLRVSQDRQLPQLPEVQHTLSIPDRSVAAASVLGTDVNTQELVTLEQDERLKGLYLIGKTGSGKTTLIVNMILQDIEAGRGLCFFDTHGDAITHIIQRLPPHREKDVILLDLLDDDFAFGLNIFQCNDPTSRREISRVKSGIMSIFAKLFTDTGDMFKEAPTMAETLSQTIPVFLAHTDPRLTLAEIPLLLMDDTARKKMLAPVKNPLVESFWHNYDRWKNDQKDKQSDSTRRRVTDFLVDQLVAEIIGQSETTIPFRRIMDERKILLVKLSRETELATSLVGSLIVHHIAQAAYSRADTLEKDRVPFFLYADEYQRFCTPTFAELLAEVRKYKIGTCVAHQFRDQLDKANRGATLNAANLVVYPVSDTDAKELAGNFKRTPPPPIVEWIEEEDGITESVKAITPHPVDYLQTSTHAHDNESVNTFASWVLPSLFDALANTSGGGCSGWPIMGASRAQLQKGIHQIDRLLVDAMQGNLSLTASALSKPITAIVLELRGHVGLESGVKMKGKSLRYTETAPQRADVIERHISTGLDGVLSPYIHLLLTNFEGSSDVLHASRVTSLSFGSEGDALRSYLLTQWDNTLLNDIPTSYLSEPRLDPLKERTNLQSEGRVYEQIENNRVRQLATAVTDLQTVVQALYALCVLLAREPIKVPTGEERRLPRKHLLTTQRSFPEMESMIADELANPTQPFTARAKLGTREYTFAALPLKAPDPDAVWQEREARIIANTRREGYCKNRDEIDKAMVERHRELTNRKPSTPQTTDDDDES